MDSNGLIYVFQTVWKNSSPIESKLKIFNMHDDPLCIHKKWIWNQEKAKRFYLSKNKFEKMVPVDMTLCDDEVHVVTQTDNKTFGLEKWRKMTDILNGEISLAQTGIDRLSTFSIAGARKYLLLVQRKADCFLQFVIMDGQVIRLSCTLNISVERQPKFSVIGDYLLFPHLNSFDILRWREGSTILVDPVQLTIRTINVIGDRWVVGSFADRDLSTYVVELEDYNHENGILYDMERLEPTNLKRSETAGISQKCLGLFSSALSGIMMFYNDESFGLLQVTNLQQDMNQEQESFHPVISP
ncbi:uncharacterized protein LOC142349290 [Convolutriloba macropyga]|uniref:uncharacterized protein LOC142349290 n=1 Tax=Convolutriloba macropyga TaxID=536237 RepID=UPI003F52268B